MSFKKIRWFTIAMLTAVFSLSAGVIGYAYIPTSRDTKVSPEHAEYDLAVMDDYELIYETGAVKYYYREDRDIIAIEDKSTGYVIKTGIDMPYTDDVEDKVKALKKDNASAEEILAAAQNTEEGLNKTYLGIANSLITIEYYDSDSIKYISSASYKNAESKLYTLNGDPSTRRLDVVFTKPDIQFSVYITFKERSIQYDIPIDEMKGSDLSILSAIDITPFLGASGGKQNIMNPDTLEWETHDKYRVPGYVLVPDGSGALIRFEDYTSSFNAYDGDIYGSDPATETYNYSSETNAVPLSDPVMPVFGIAQGNDQIAFVAWADSGAEHMDIIVNPDETNNVSYTWAYPRFEYNNKYFQVYNQQGDGYFKTMDEPMEFNISMTYEFLFGDGSNGSPSADYVGMAQAYRSHLIDNGTITPMPEDDDKDIPIRLDFIMADSKKGIIGTDQVVVTTADDVGEILNSVMENGISNINSGLIGWQKGGETISRPYLDKFSSEIGTKREFKNLIGSMAEKGVEVSYCRDFSSLNSLMISFNHNAAQHINTWYLSLDRSAGLPENAPIQIFGYIKPTKSVKWMKQLADKVSDYCDGFTITGVTNTLVSTYDRNGIETSLSDAIGLYQDALEQIGKNMKLNLENPNMYLWKYTDRYLLSPVGSSQYAFESDSVPFLQMVINGTMEVYAPYANFSFYTQDCILKMIDYNIYPSFILSKQPSWYLSDTFSCDLYSTEYSLYDDMIADIYSQINEVLSQVKGYEWTNRVVPENGIVINEYSGGSSKIQVVINYTEKTYQYEGISIPPESAQVIR